LIRTAYIEKSTRKTVGQNQSKYPGEFGKRTDSIRKS
jgi:Fe-S cluster biosynthesis and repair protein YggX